MPVQMANAEAGELWKPEFFGNAFENLHEPLGDFGVWNGQFEIGPDSYPEGWELQATGTQVLTRTTGGLAGNYCMMGGDTGAGVGPILLSLRYIPVDETRAYYVGGAFRASAVTGTVNFGVYCYSAAKAYLGTAWPLTAVAPGVAWVRYERRVGAGTFAAFPAGTRYVRVMVQLQTTAVLPGVYSYCDDIQFQQLKATHSPLITLDSAYVTNTVSATNNTGVGVIHAQLNLTVTERGYIWYMGQMWTSNNTIRTLATCIQIYVGGVAQAVGAEGCAVVGTIATTTLAGRIYNTVLPGVTQVDMRWWNINPADTSTAYRTYLYAFWVRAL